MTEPAHNPSNPAHVQKRKVKDRFRQEQQMADLTALLRLPEFRRYIWRHINETCMTVAKPGFSPNGSIQSHNLGMQSVGAQLWAEIESVDAKLLPQMMLEYLALQEQQQ